jgi:hypothetical protein
MSDDANLTESMESLHQGIDDRTNELSNVAEAIARFAGRLTLTANTIKVVTILLGAITAAKGTFDTVHGVTDHVGLVVFSTIGIVISVSTGIEAAFKFDKRGAELMVLAASCTSQAGAVNTEWLANIKSHHGTDQRDAARKLIKVADDQLAKVHDAAARLGFNVAIDARKR